MTCLEARFHAEVERRRAIDSEREALRLLPPDQERDRMLVELGSDTADDYVARALPFVMEYEREQKGGSRQLQDFRTQRSQNHALATNKRKLRQFRESNGTMCDFVTLESGRRLRDIYERYMEVAEGAPRHDRPAIDVCNLCKDCQEPMCVDARSGSLICTSCGLAVDDTLFMSAGRDPYANSETSSIITRFPYLRINHFNETMQHFCAKENANVPEDVMGLVRTELERQHQPLAACTPERVRAILKQHKQNRWYDHAPQVCKRLGGRAPYEFTREQEDRARAMFWSIQAPFDRLRPSDRSNFLSYNYTLLKIAQLIGVPAEALKGIHMLKSRDKLVEHDLLWKKICAELSWPFHRTV